MQAAGEAQTRRADDLRVLQVALRPAAIANGDIDQRRRRLFPGTAAVGRHPHLPSTAAYQRRFDEIVGENMAAEGLAALERRQAAVVRERLDANDGIVA